MASSDDYIKSLLGLSPLQPHNSLLDLLAPTSAVWPTPLAALGNALATAPPTTKRRAYFAFHFDDIMRVNNVRNAWKIDHPDNAIYRSFQDSSLWERRQLEGDEAVKRLIREGVQYTSAVCVLAGTDTWLRRWVRYEIARAIINERGLLTVHINGLNHYQTRAPNPRGENPLAYMAVGKVQPHALYEPKYYLFEREAVFKSGQYQFEWHRYEDYTDPVDKPRWLTDPAPGMVTPLSWNAAEYDYAAQLGDKSIGSWIDTAAVQAGR